MLLGILRRAGACAMLLLLLGVSQVGAQGVEMTLTPSPSSPAANQPVTWTAAVPGGNDGWEFRFTRYDDEVVVQEWGPSNVYVAPAYGAEGTFGMIADARRAGEDDLYADAMVTVGPPLLADLVADRSQGYTGEPFTFTASASGGTGSGFTYAFSVDGEGPFQSGTAPGFSRSFATPGPHTVSVEARDSGNNRVTDSVVVTVLAELSVALAVEPAEARAGEPFTFTATAAGGSGAGYEFAFFVDAAVEPARPFGAARTFTVAFPDAGPHTVRVLARDDEGHQAMRTVSLAVAAPPPPLLTGHLEITPEKPRKGERVTVRAVPQGGGGSTQIRWDVNLYDWPDDEDFRTGGGPETSFTMPDRERVVVRARITDEAGQAIVLRREIVRERDWAASLRILPGEDVELHDSVLVEGSASDGAPPVRLTLSERGLAPEVFAGGWGTLARSWNTPGSHEFVLVAEDGEGRRAELTRTVRVDPTLKPDVVVESEDVDASDDRRVRADASGPQGGRAPYRFSFDLGADGIVEQDGASPVLSRRFSPSALPKTLRLTVTDAVGRVRSAVRPVPARCSKDVAVGLVQVRTAGCLVNRGSEAVPRYETAAAVTVNGIPMKPQQGKRFVLEGGTRADPGGRLGIADVTIKVGATTLWRGDVDWALPAPQSSQGFGEGTAAQLGVPDQAKLLGLPVEGSFGLRFGRSAGRAGTDREFYATFPLQFGLPSIFKSRKGGGTEGGVTAEGAVRVDAAGTHYDGLKLQVADVWAGSVLVKQVCLSYVPAGGEAVSPCAAPTLDGREYVSCRTDVDTDRWNATATVQLPGGSNTRLAAFGGIAGGSLSSLGGYVDNARIPIVSGVYLSRIGFGFCAGPPLVLRGDVGVQILPAGPSELVQINGYFIYTDPWRSDPWSIELGGSVELRDFPVGQGFVKVRPSGLIDFGATAALKLPQANPVVTVEGGLKGWVEIPSRRFTVEGHVRGCLVSLDACAGARALISNRGIAGCLEVVGLEGGFGYLFVTKEFDLFSGCDMSAYASVPTTARSAQAGAPLGFDVAAGKQAAVEITGLERAPKVTLRGPDGTVIASPADRESAAEQRRYVLVENAEAKTTSVLIGEPAPGRWTVEGEGIGEIRTARYVGPTEISGRVARGAGGGRRFRAAIRFTAPEGTHVQLVEKSGTVQRTIAGDLVTRACGDARCASTDFAATDGPGGRRELIAVLTRDGMPAGVHVLDTYAAPPAIRPGRPRGLRIERSRGAVLVRWGAARRSDGHAIEVRTTFGKRYPVIPREDCTTLRLAGIARGEGVRLRVTGLRGNELREGPAATVTLKRGRARAGASGAAGRPCQTATR